MHSHLLAASLLLALPLVTAGPASAAPPRTHGELTVGDPPRAPSEDGLGKRFPAIEGALVLGSPRVWVGAPVPAHVPLGAGELELWWLAPTARGHVALYVEPFAVAGGDRGCGRGKDTWANCGYLLRHYTNDGALAWEVDPSAHFRRKDHLALASATLVGDTLYYAEACQTYAADANGKCSELVALDVSASPARLLWRSKPLVANTDVVAIADGRWLVTGYGFTAEKDALHIVDATTGKVARRVAVPKAPQRITLGSDGRLLVHLYDEPEPRRYRVVLGKAATAAPTLALED